MSERWLPIPGYEGRYSVSDIGRVRSDYRCHRILRPYTTKRGYARVCLSRDDRKQMALVHRLVALAFIGPSDLQVCHLDHTPLNNRLENLVYGTAAENRHQSVEDGRLNPWRKLTPDQVGIIIEDLRKGFAQRALARRYGVSMWAIISIRRGRTWATHPARAAAQSEAA